ncbi:MAG: ABC-2 family transporter protein [Lachnospiraceae bacterium]|nr:ABC-2 family transporter protein [Lachnospiraceae bacterium]
MNYFKIYKRFVIIYMKGKLEYHLSLLFELFANTILIGVYFAGFLVIFHNFDNIAGWNKYEVLFMFTTSWLSYSFSCFFFWSPMKDMGEQIRSGNFDLYLTRPISPFTYLVLQQFQYTFLPRLFFSIFFWLYSMSKLKINWNAASVFYYCICLLSAFVIFSSITVITGAISFWTVKSEEIVSLLTNNNYGLKNYCDYPITIYSKSMQILLTFIIPYAFTGYYPVANLLDKSSPASWAAYISPAIALIIAIFAYILWRMGLKHYGSTGA